MASWDDYIKEPLWDEEWTTADQAMRDIVWDKFNCPFGAVEYRVENQIAFRSHIEKKSYQSWSDKVVLPNGYTVEQMVTVNYEYEWVGVQVSFWITIDDQSVLIHSVYSEKLEVLENDEYGSNWERIIDMDYEVLNDDEIEHDDPKFINFAKHFVFADAMAS